MAHHAHEVAWGRRYYNGLNTQELQAESSKVPGCHFWRLWSLLVGSKCALQGQKHQAETAIAANANCGTANNNAGVVNTAVV